MAQALPSSRPSTPAIRKRTRRPGVPVHWIMLAPAMALLFGLMIYPAFNAVYLSLTSTNLLALNLQKFIGLDNFEKMLADPTFYKAIGNTLIWAVGAVSIQLVFGMIGALALNESIRFRGLIRGMVLLPWATPSVLIALMFMWILDVNLGIANRMLEAVGLNGQPWLSGYETALPTLILIQVWQGIPFFAVMILAALQGVPHELVEAARIDGANSWNSFWRVVLPLIMPTVLITITLRLIWTANYFDLMLILTNGGPANATLTLPLYAYQTAYRGMDFGLGAAMSVAQAIALAALVLLYMRQVRKSEIA